MQFIVDIKAVGWDNFTRNECSGESFPKGLSLTFLPLCNTAVSSHYTYCLPILPRAKAWNRFTSKSFGRGPLLSVMLCHPSFVFHTIILYLVPNFQGKTLIFCCMFPPPFFFNLSFQVSVEKLSPLLDLKVLNFLSPYPIIYLDGPIFSRLIITFTFVLTFSRWS